jgi:hypothetical protein
MKASKFFAVLPVLGLLVAPLEAAVFAADFEGLSEGDLNNQGGWTTTETTPEASYVIGAAGSFGTKAGYLGSGGFVPTVSANEVYVKNSFGGGASLANAELSVLFQLYDSSNSRASRDTFGFRLEDSGNNNLFSFVLSPVAQSTNPNGTLGQWSFGYTTGNGAVIPFYSNAGQTLVWAADESVNGSPEYNMTITFAEFGLSGDVQMNVNVNGVAIGGGVLDNLASSSIDEFGVFWRPTSGPSSTGDNGIAFDNITVIPEPGIASLAGIAGLLCLMARRRA